MPSIRRYLARRFKRLPQQLLTAAFGGSSAPTEVHSESDEFYSRYLNCGIPVFCFGGSTMRRASVANTTSRSTTPVLFTEKEMDMLGISGLPGNGMEEVCGKLAAEQQKDESLG
jgi:hypothetical protein